MIGSLTAVDIVERRWAPARSTDQHATGQPLVWAALPVLIDRSGMEGIVKSPRRRRYPVLSAA
jgi:hypothetical protein